MQNVSIIIPVMDEQETIGELVSQLMATFDTLADHQISLAEIMFVDDGSTDNTWNEVQSCAAEVSSVSGFRLRRNFGKAAALQVGIAQSRGDIIITMDGDLQDGPKEIPKFLEAIHAGSEVVSGWKQTRHDPLGKTLPSKLFNMVTARVAGVDLHDFNCGFKAYRREVFDNIRLYGELHRFIPVLAHAAGYKVSEVVVQHHARRHGKSKYGVGRLLKGFLDLLTVVTITRFNSRPGHLFGGLGFAVGSIGALIFLYLSVRWLGGEAIGGRPLLLVAVLLVIVGVQFTLFGLVGELIVATRSDDTSPNIVSEITASGSIGTGPAVNGS